MLIILLYYEARNENFKGGYIFSLICNKPSTDGCERRVALLTTSVTQLTIFQLASFKEDTSLIIFLQNSSPISKVCLLNTRNTQIQNTQRYVGRTAFLIKYVL